mgnify:CR=1 FL=1
MHKKAYLSLLFLFIPQVCFSTVYKCINESGDITFSQLKCSPDAEEVKIKNKAPQPATSNQDKVLSTNFNFRLKRVPYDHRRVTVEKNSINRQLSQWPEMERISPDAWRRLKAELWQLNDDWYNNNLIYHYDSYNKMIALSKKLGIDEAKKKSEESRFQLCRQSSQRIIKIQVGIREGYLNQSHYDDRGVKYKEIRDHFCG